MISESQFKNQKGVNIKELPVGTRLFVVTTDNQYIIQKTDVEKVLIDAAVGKLEKRNLRIFLGCTNKKGQLFRDWVKIGLRLKIVQANQIIYKSAEIIEIELVKNKLRWRIGQNEKENLL